MITGKVPILRKLLFEMKTTAVIYRDSGKHSIQKSFRVLVEHMLVLFQQFIMVEAY